MKNYLGRGVFELYSLLFFMLDYYEIIMLWYFGDMGYISGMVIKKFIIILLFNNKICLYRNY